VLSVKFLLAIKHNRFLRPLLTMATYNCSIQLTNAKFNEELDFILQAIQTIETSMRSKHYGSSLTLAHIKYFLYNYDNVKRCYSPKNINNNNDTGFELWDILPISNLWLHTFMETQLGFDLSQLSDTTSEIECATWQFKDEHEFAANFAEWMMETFYNHGITFVWEI